ncbi:MAG: dTMP kinase [Porticoccaceae bacterium]|jgi:dTMP kinase|nr:dTMP kinase [Porticoccaceae bacterium]|tara:strand:- start:5646 stop:6281 length:636 start_codon:yes stop_codon:yes gene_type:complete
MVAKFITVEGTEGVGKTTNINFIKSWLKQNEIKFVATREPGGTPLAEEIRDLLLKPRDELVVSTAELLLMFAGRAQHLNKVILPALQADTWVLCDRFTDATYAYQGFGRQMTSELIVQLENIVQGDIRPDLTLLLDIPVEIGLERANDRGDPDRFEQEQQDFFNRVRAGYLSLANENSDRYVVIDASQEIQGVQTDIALALDTFYKSLGHE